MNSETIIAWLKEHPLIKISALETACNMPSNSIHRALRGLENIAPKHIPALVKTLAKYGFNETKSHT